MSLKIECSCPVCEHDDTKKYRSFAIGYLADSKDVVSMKCNAGHEFQATLEIPKFAFMFENGLTAYNAGFYFEAFTCFYSALELFRIDFIKTYFCVVNHNDYELLDEQVKYIKYSEKIYGIYMMCFALYFKESADKKSATPVGKVALVDDDRKLRNRVVHAGKLITPKECSDLGYKIYKYIRTIYQLFNHPNFTDDDIVLPAIMGFYFHKSQAEKAKNPNIKIIPSDTLTSMQLGSLLDLENLPTFEELLKKNKGHNINKDSAEHIVSNKLFAK